MSSEWLALGISVVALLGSWLARTPKEEITQLRADVDRLERDARDYAGIHGRHDQALITLTAAINKLTDRFDAYMGNANGHSRRG